MENTETQELEQNELNGDTSAQEDDVIDEHAPEQVVKIRDRGGNVREYVVREMDDVGKWMNYIAKRVRTGKDRDKTDYSGMHSELISLCLYYKDDNGSAARVPKRIVQTWGPKAQNKVFELCQKINGLDTGAEDREGKD